MFPVVSRTPRFTINDVAKQAGVSVATVSKVVNQRYGVAAATIERVQRVVDELGYESSLVARSLRNHKTNVIGILVADLEPYSTEVLKGAARAIRGSGYELVVYSGGGLATKKGSWEQRYLSRLGGTLIDGAILVTPTVVEASSDVPIVAIDAHRGPLGLLHTIDSDNWQGASLATEHLVGLGHRRIGFLSGRQDLESAHQRERGVQEVLARHGLTLDPALVRCGEFEREPSMAAAHALLTMADPPTAIFAANDISAIATLEVARNLGISVPGDLSIVGFDNIPETAMTDPQLTTVEQPIQEMGRLGITMLLGLMQGHEPVERHVTLATRLVVRQSTARPAAIASRPARSGPSGLFRRAASALPKGTS